MVFLHKGGANDAKIREAYPDLTPAQIHAALAYYYDNREEIEDRLDLDDARKALSDSRKKGGKPIPWEKARQLLGL